MKDKLILSNNAEIAIESGSSLSDMIVLSTRKSEMVEKWDMLTSENLKRVQIKNSDGEVIGIYENIVLDSETSTIQPDGTILTCFRLRKKTEAELLRDEINSLKEELTGTQIGLAETYEMIEGLAGGN
ncbi:MAG: hypothetical protein K1W10_02265 [Lachnospiraceae bacterium]